MQLRFIQILFLAVSLNRLLKRAPIALLLIAVLFGVHSSQAQTIQATQLTLVNPSACPPAGCAAGQTVDLRASFDLKAFDPALAPNVRVCVYTTTNWAAESFRIDSTGAVTGADYQPDMTCAPEPGYTTLGGVSAQVFAGAIGDLLNLGFRIGKSAAANGSALLRIFEQDASGWKPADQSIAFVNVIPSGSVVYAANDAAACGSYSPCYLNSGADLPGGIGTGLKDAVDALPTSVTILGNYPIKSNTVLVNQALTLQGLNDSRITYQGANCLEPMLRLTAGVTLRSLTITDGACTAPNRDLVEVDSPQDIIIEYVDLIAGQNALKVSGNTGNVTLRFSQVMDNSEYAVLRSLPPSGGMVQAVGNNLYNNRPGIQMDCGNAGSADHNFWGFGVAATSATSQCTVNDYKRLGAPAQPRSADAGVLGERVTVTTTKQPSFNGLVGYQRSADGSDFSLNLINHGAGSPENVPFTGGAPGSLIACSNYYDIFLEKDAIPSTQLNLSLRYDRTAGCTTTVETSAYCASTDPANFPLWWYSTPGGWNTTGATGQETNCNTTTKEIQVAIDASGRPDFSNDLNFTPFVVGLPPLSSSVVITRFVAIPGNAQATIQWTTASEVNTSGFYVLRSLAAAGPFGRVSGFIVHTGTSASGANYEYIDPGLTNNTTYYYRLEIVSTSLGSSFSNVISATIGQPTPTSTQTLTSTVTSTLTQTITPTGPTPTPTGSLTRTPTRTVTLTRFPTRTRTPIRYATYYIFRSPTPAPSRTPFPTRTITPTLTLFPGARTSTAQAVDTLQPQPSVTLTPETTDIGTAYPPSGGTQISSIGTLATAEETSLAATSTATSTAAAVSPDALPGYQPPAILTFGKRNWPWILGLLGLELVTVGVAAFFLNKRGLLTIPPPEFEERDPED